MDRKEVVFAAQAYIDEMWPRMVEDIARLVRIASVEELGSSAPGAPFGPGPRAALDEALAIARDMGLSTCDVDGYMGYADLPGKTETQIGIIGHMDVVPAGPGWNFEPFSVTEREGCLVGRGVLDDKGPSVMALHAMKCLAQVMPERNERNYTVRMLFGVNEESGMNDVPYYRERHADPAFLFTPDAEFPVCYGEKGGFDALITSAPFTDPAIVEFEGGTATNAVPGVAHVVVRADAADLPKAENLTIEPVGENLARIEAAGKSAHAATPDEGVNAIALIVDYLIDQGICSDEERVFLEFEQKLLGATDGSGVGLKTADEHFGPLTVIGGTIAMKDGCLVQSLDSRFPTSITPDEIESALRRFTDPMGAKLERTLLREPFLVKPETPAIQTLLAAYNDVTGEGREPFTIGGGTYARGFMSGASFGPEMPWLEMPAWAGSMHGPDEAVSVEQLKTAFKIYVLALFDLQHIEL